jgi:hypothetical protein
MGNVLYFMEKRNVFIGFESPQRAGFSGQEALKATLVAGEVSKESDSGTLKKHFTVIIFGRLRQ